MKEEDAKKKMCPKLMAAAIAGKSDADDVIYTDLVYCKGSFCMMWEADTKFEGAEHGAISIDIDTENGDCGLKHKSFKRVGNVEISE